MISEDYVSFEVAKLLKEKGFPQTRMLGDFITNMVCEVKTNESGKHSLFLQYPDRRYNKDRYIAAPTLQMTMKWLREVHNIIFVFKPSYFSGDVCTYWSYERWCGDNFDGEVLSFKSYEQACEAAIKYCLENLI